MIREQRTTLLMSRRSVRQRYVTARFNVFGSTSSDPRGNISDFYVKIISDLFLNAITLALFIIFLIEYYNTAFQQYNVL